jgi:hypothetical protein
MKRFLKLILIICLVSLSLPVQVVAGECTNFVNVKHYTDVLDPNSMISYGVVGYVYFTNNHSNISYYNATIIDAYMNVQANGSIHIDIYKTHWSGNTSRITFEFMRGMDLIAQPGVGLNESVALPYLNGHILFGDKFYVWTPSIVLLITNLASYTINLDMTVITCWNVYFVEDDVVLTTGEIETTETTEQSTNETETVTTTTTSNIITKNATPSIWTIVMGVIVIGEFVTMTVIGKLIILKRREMNGV